MCDSGCRKRFSAIETDIAVIGTDIKWVKKIVTTVFLLAASALGLDITGLV